MRVMWLCAYTDIHIYKSYSNTRKITFSVSVIIYILLSIICNRVCNDTLYHI